MTLGLSTVGFPIRLPPALQRWFRSWATRGSASQLICIIGEPRTRARTTTYRDSRISERWTRGPLGTLVYGDEIDRMPSPLRTRWFKQLAELGATVVIGTHRDLGGLGRRVGFTVRTHLLGQADPDELVEVLTKRIAAVALPGAATPFRFSDAEIDRILAESGGNLRAADSVSHRLVAQRVAGRGVTER